MKMRKAIISVSLLMELLFAPGAIAYDVTTHAAMSEASANSANLDAILYSLGLTRDSVLDATAVRRPDDNRGTVIGWIREGSIREDGDSVCSPRPKQHFYDPITNAGYSRLGFQGQPSATWGLEDIETYGDQEYSYRDAKEYLWTALTAKNDDDHQRNLALTFRTLGQVIHLVQDAAQPQHTRNDSHAGFVCPATLGLLGPKSLYESYVDKLARAKGLSFGGYAPVSLSQPRYYWDDENGRGIAEFSNRNFVTAGTNFYGPPYDIRYSGYSLPNGVGAAISKVDIQTLVPGTLLHGKITFISTPWNDIYLPQTDYNPRTSSYSIFNAELTRYQYLPGYTLNRFNFDTAIPLLIPRAVGYSAGLLNFFFRGTLEIGPPDRFAYFVAPHYTNGQYGQFTKLKVNVRNTTVGADTGSGTLQAIVRYRTTYLTDPLVWPWYAGLDQRWSYAVSKPLQNVSVPRDWTEFEFDFSDNPLSVKIGDVSVTIAYRGPLVGETYTETDAVAFSGKDVFEPQLIDFGNSSDYDCYRDVLYDVIGLQFSQRDVDGDGRTDLFGPSSENGSYIRIQAWGAPITPLTSQTANYQVPGLSWAQYGRFVTVQDSPAYRVVYSSPDVLDEMNGDHTPYLTTFTLSRAVNHFIEQNGQLVHEVGPYFTFSYRGTSSVVHVDMVNQNVINSQTCMDAVRGVPRPMTEIAGSVAGTN
jgi:hypothetical protein